MSLDYATIVYLNKHKEMIGAAGLAAAMAHPQTRRAGVVATVWSARHLVAPAMYHTGMAAAVPAQNLGRLILPHLARASGAVAVGAITGAAVGTGISRALWGSTGQSHAVDLYTGKVSKQKWTQAISSIPRHFIPDLSKKLPWN